MRPLWLLLALVGPAGASLRLSVYATAGDVNRYLATPEGRERGVETLRRFRSTRIFLEGRRGDEYVPPATLSELRRYFEARQIRTTGAIATVPGKQFGVRQNEKLGWLNWEAEKTRRDVAQFFTENAAVFDEIMVDDFYCTGDTTPESERARGGRSWGQYRQDLLVSLIEPLMRRPGARLILKYPQWYDRFHRFGYDPERMSALVDEVWVGTEVRNPETPRMGYVQPTEGYINFRWLRSVAGAKVKGAWFDHIECTAQNFVDQAWQSVLAGAEELTLFHLGDLMEGHPGHAPFLEAWPEMVKLAASVQGREARGVAFYKPVGSDGDGDLYLMDYLAMLGVPVVPVSRYPAEAPAVVLGAQAAADPRLREHLQRHRGATIVVTPALVRRLGGQPPATVLCNVSTFTKEDYRATGEWLLPPKPLRLELPHRDALLRRLGLRLEAPWGVGFYWIGDQQIFYNFRREAVEVRLWDRGQSWRREIQGSSWAARRAGRYASRGPEVGDQL
jgi:hypothetical protein